MLGFNKKTLEVNDQIKKDLEDKRKQLMVDRMPRIEHLINSPGWADFVELVDEYIEACKKRKAITAIDRADEKVLYELRLLDHEIFILSWLKGMPEQFIHKVQERMKKDAG